MATGYRRIWHCALSHRAIAAGDDHLFATIGIALINALSSQPEGWMEMAVINVLVLAFIYLLEKFLLREGPSNQRKLNVSVPVAELEKQLGSEGKGT